MGRTSVSDWGAVSEVIVEEGRKVQSFQAMNLRRQKGGR
jgi:hypothetical protein